MPISAIVLTGGHSQRMGRDKALLHIGDETFLGLIARKLATLSDDVLMAGTLREGYAEAVAGLSVRFVEDSFEKSGPLGGLHAGLQAMRHPAAIVVACDMPWVSVALLEHMVEMLDTGRGKPCPYDAVVPRDEAGWHPLHAVYHQSCVSTIESMLRAGDLRVQNLIQRLNVRVIEQREIAQFDPRLLSVKNLNTPDDLAALKALKAP
jgi:molybdopterin-guanine dinucleotide biosynthesis protein A